jgi:hypothetical protein
MQNAKPRMGTQSATSLHIHIYIHIHTSTNIHMVHKKCLAKLTNIH